MKNFLLIAVAAVVVVVVKLQKNNFSFMNRTQHCKVGNKILEEEDEQPTIN